MSRPRLVFLYGPPAVGKLTVARAIAERQPFKILHNHVTIDAVAQVLPFGTEAFWGVVGRLRRDLVGAAAEEGIDLIYTYVFAPGDEQHVADIVAAYESRGGIVSFVQLLAPREVLLERVLQADRKEHGKIADRETLARLLDQYDNFTVAAGYETRTIDLGEISAAAAAEAILAHF